MKRNSGSIVQKWYWPVVLSVVLLLFALPSGAQYFQQEVNYKIEVRLNDQEHSLSAFETFVYKNNSTVVLTELYIHLWPNAYKNRQTALFKQFFKSGNTKAWFTPSKDMGYMDSLRFSVDGKEVKWQCDPIHIDICRLELNEPLLPGGSITVSTPFFVKLPSATISRLGHTGQSYSISQWYPKPAVFDSKGWHAMPYLDQGEFYSEFGSFEVQVTLPKNYVVGATGNLQDDEERAWMNTRAKETESLVVFDKTMAFPESDPEFKTITFKQNNVHDFAWFADKRFHVLKGEVELPHSKEKVTTWALFTNAHSELWKKSISYINRGLYQYSLWNGDYPYSNCTAVDGAISAGNGMEYPCITIIGKLDNDHSLESVIVHEVGHNWFYGILGSNERDHGWMDEGVNTSNEIRYVTQFYGSDTNLVKSYLGNTGPFGKLTGLNRIDAIEFAYLEYMISARRHTEQPIATTSEKFSTTNYGTIMYAKACLGFTFLRDYLGDSLYDVCMQEYFNRWKFRHPYPEDMHRIFTEVSGRDLGWFFNDFIRENSRIDYKITSSQRIYGNSFINPIAKGYAVRICNNGNMVSPFSVSTMKDDKITGTQWHQGFMGSDTMFISCENCDNIRIDAQHRMPDVNRKNNTTHTHGILKTMEKISFPFLVKMENPDRTQLYWIPVAGWNNYDKTMAGLALHNLSFLPKKLEFGLAPMYSFGTNQLAGSGVVNYTIYPEFSDFENISVSFHMARFAYLIDDYKDFNSEIVSSPFHYEKFNGMLKFKLNKSDPASSLNRFIVLRNLNLWKEEVVYEKLNNSEYIGRIGRIYQYHNQLIASVNNSRAIDPYKINLTFEQNKNYLKGSLEVFYRMSFKQKGRGVDFRLFFGSFISNLNSTRSFRLNGLGGTSVGSEDYLFDNIYLGRSEYEGLLSKQFYEQEGGFKIYSPVSRSDKWIATLNMKVHLPGRMNPFRLFLDIGLYDGSNRVFKDYKGVTYCGGICLSLIQNIAEVYFPVLLSKDINKYYTDFDLRFKDKIRFVLNLNALSPFRLRDSLLPN